MLLLVVLWLLLAYSALCIGYALLLKLGHLQKIDRNEDRFFAALWIGIFLIAVLAEASAHFIPLAGTGLVLFAIAALIAGVSRTIRNEIYIGLRQVPRIAILLLFAAGLYAAQPVYWYDTGLYHAQLIKWLSAHGIVTGLGQWHFRFGFLSSWLALPAAFDAHFLAGRMFTLMGGGALLMACLHCMCVLRAIAERRAQSQDVFLGVSLTLALPVVLAYGVSISPSPDLPIIVIPIITSWLILVTATHQAAVLPLVLALCALTIKLSSLPLLSIVTVYFLVRNSAPIPRRFVLMGVLIVVLLFPHVAGVFRVSGCLLYPVGATCADVPWGLGADQAMSVAASVTEWARWNGHAPAQATPIEWFDTWFGFSPDNKVFAGLLLLSLLLTPIAWRKGNADYKVVLAIALFGIGFVILTAPVLRFALGYLVIVPALAAVTVGTNRKVVGRSWLRWAQFSLLSIAALPLVFMVLHFNPFQRIYYSVLDQGRGPNPGEQRLNYLLPPVLAGVAFERSSIHKYEVVGVVAQNIVKRKVNGAYAYSPDKVSGELCWNAPIPCIPQEKTSN